MHAGNFVVVTKQEFLVLLSFTTLLYDVIMTSYCTARDTQKVSGNDFVPAGQCTSTLRRARATVELLRQETPNVRSTCGLQTVQILVLWITRSGLSCSIVSTTDKSIVWMNWNGGLSMSGAVLNSQFLTRLLTSVEEYIERVSMLNEDISSTACELTM